jgi:two-component system response regulator YesN
MRPATILVVDDEPFMRDMIVSLLRESESDYIVVGEAINGLLALEFLRERPVDIVLTDIRMPVMDGLELIRESAKRAIPVGFVVLSAYNEFHIVKDAFKLGAWDFLLKSEITRTDLLQVLDGVAARLVQERDTRISSDEVGAQLRQILAGTMKPAGKVLDANVAPMDSDTARFRVLIIRAIGEKRKVFLDPGARQPWNGLNESLAGFRMETVPAKLLVTSLGGDEAAVVFVSPDLEADNSLPEAMFKFAAQRAAAEGMELQGGLSSIAKTAEKLPKLYREARSAMSLWFFRGRGKLLDYDSEKTGHESGHPIECSSHADALRNILDLKNGRELEKQADNLMLRLDDPSPQDTDAIRDLFQSYRSLLGKAVEEESPDDFLEIKAILSEFDSYIRDEGTLEEFNRWLRDSLLSFSEALRSRSPLVRKTVEYISAHLDEDLALAEVARFLGVSEGYFSRTFSKEMKCSFVKYLSRIRMNFALRLLRTTVLKIYEIAERTGYRNSEHFSRTFKKIMGGSPKEYR